MEVLQLARRTTPILEPLPVLCRRQEGLRERGSRPGIQPVHRNLWRDESSFQRQWELWKALSSRKNGQAAYTQHQTTAQGSVGTVQTTTGAKGAAATGANGNYGAVGQTTTAYHMRRPTEMSTRTPEVVGPRTQGTANQKSTSGYSGGNSAAARGYGGQEGSSSSSAFGGRGNGWQTERRALGALQAAVVPARASKD